MKVLWGVQTTEKVWSTFGLNTNLGKFSYQLEPQLRVMNRQNVYDQFLNNFNGSYQLSPQLVFTLGTTYVNTWQNQGSNLQETRLLEQVSYTPRRYSWLSIRSRIEQRKRQDSNQLNYRLRERLTLKKRLTDSLSLVGFDEIFINLNQPDWISTKTFDQNRILISLDQQASKSLVLGAGYIYQYILSKPRQVGHIASLYAQLTLPTEVS
ncbi:DUF2490 domain-containing protein [Legionella cardiaca]|uniref:DUF2490 domain-containing protein n=1 Tax=Legionella cardiaca TaxID=1071983 RepID=A0ABY8AUK8_9GAMM|nr:DUF2490 domain-containing protein [Legionella cardiaca]WED44358.1 DUF2490 domain-containing protein [Legionella cardiaca]